MFIQLPNGSNISILTTVLLKQKYFSTILYNKTSFNVLKNLKNINSK